MRSDLYIILVHHPVLDKNGTIVTTALTNMDIHDIARSAFTFGVRRFFVVHPVRALQALAEKILEHWESGYGSTYNTTRKEALSLTSVQSDLDDALIEIERLSGRRPWVVVTSARSDGGSIGFEELRRRLDDSSEPCALILGTGWGLAPAVLERADARLEPILGTGDYNHLSVRAAAAIILDRLRGKR